MYIIHGKIWCVSVCVYTHMEICTYIYMICTEGIQLCNMKNRDIYWRRCKIQEILYIGQWCLSPLQSKYLGTSHNSPSRHQLPHPIFLNCIDEISSLSKVILVLGKARSQIWAVGGLSPLVTWCFTKNLCMRCDASVGVLSGWSCQSAVAHSCGLLNHPNSFHGGMLKLNTIWCRFVALLAQSFWMQQPHSTHAHSVASTTPTD